MEIEGIEVPDFPLKEAEMSAEYISQFPETWAKNDFKRYKDFIKKIIDMLRDVYDKDELEKGVKRIAEGWMERYRELLHFRSQVASPYVVGPANFPSRTMEKKRESWERREKALDEYEAKMIKLAQRLKKEKEIERAGGELAVTEHEIEELKSMLESMKAVNKIIKSKKLTDEEKVRKLKEEFGLCDRKIAELMTPDELGRVGYKSYELESIRNKIHRLEDKLEKLKAKEAKGGQAEVIEERPEFKIVADYGEDRVKIYFPSIPPEDLRAKLKSSAFKWSPKRKAWVRKLTDNAIYDAQSILHNYYNLGKVLSPTEKKIQERTKGWLEAVGAKKEVKKVNEVKCEITEIDITELTPDEMEVYYVYGSGANNKEARGKSEIEELINELSKPFIYVKNIANEEHPCANELGVKLHLSDITKYLYEDLIYAFTGYNLRIGLDRIELVSRKRKVKFVMRYTAKWEGYFKAENPEDNLRYELYEHYYPSTNRVEFNLSMWRGKEGNVCGNGCENCSFEEVEKWFKECIEQLYKDKKQEYNETENGDAYTWHVGTGNVSVKMVLSGKQLRTIFAAISTISDNIPVTITREKIYVYGVDTAIKNGVMINIIPEKITINNQELKAFTIITGGKRLPKPNNSNRYEISIMKTSTGYMMNVVDLKDGQAFGTFTIVSTEPGKRENLEKLKNMLVNPSGGTILSYDSYKYFIKSAMRLKHNDYIILANTRTDLYYIHSTDESMGQRKIGKGYRNPGYWVGVPNEAAKFFNYLGVIKRDFTGMDFRYDVDKPIIITLPYGLTTIDIAVAPKLEEVMTNKERDVLEKLGIYEGTGVKSEPEERKESVTLMEQIERAVNESYTHYISRYPKVVECLGKLKEEALKDASVVIMNVKDPSTALYKVKEYFELKANTMADLVKKYRRYLKDEHVIKEFNEALCDYIEGNRDKLNNWIDRYVHGRVREVEERNIKADVEKELAYLYSEYRHDATMVEDSFLSWLRERVYEEALKKPNPVEYARETYIKYASKFTGLFNDYMDMCKDSQCLIELKNALKSLVIDGDSSAFNEWLEKQDEIKNKNEKLDRKTEVKEIRKLSKSIGKMSKEELKNFMNLLNDYIHRAYKTEFNNNIEIDIDKMLQIIKRIIKRWFNLENIPDREIDLHYVFRRKKIDVYRVPLESTEYDYDDFAYWLFEIAKEGYNMAELINDWEVVKNMVNQETFADILHSLIEAIKEELNERGYSEKESMDIIESLRDVFIKLADEVAHSGMTFNEAIFELNAYLPKPKTVEVKPPQKTKMTKDEALGQLLTAFRDLLRSVGVSDVDYEVNKWRYDIEALADAVANGRLSYKEAKERLEYFLPPPRYTEMGVKRKNHERKVIEEGGYKFEKKQKKPKKKKEEEEEWIDLTTPQGQLSFVKKYWKEIMKKGLLYFLDELGVPPDRKTINEIVMLLYKRWQGRVPNTVRQWFITQCPEAKQVIDNLLYFGVNDSNFKSLLGQVYYRYEHIFEQNGIPMPSYEEFYQLFRDFILSYRP